MFGCTLATRSRICSQLRRTGGSAATGAATRRLSGVTPPVWLAGFAAGELAGWPDGSEDPAVQDALDEMAGFAGSGAGVWVWGL